MSLSEERPMWVQMELNRIMITDGQDQQIIWLREVDGERTFPIVIGNPEAVAIDRRLKGAAAQRPMTHDLLANVIEEMGGTVDRIEINNLKNHTFYARLHIRQNDKILQIDSRP